jgi:hypothetical protein
MNSKGISSPLGVSPPYDTCLTMRSTSDERVQTPLQVVFLLFLQKGILSPLGVSPPYDTCLTMRSTSDEGVQTPLQEDLLLFLQ